jgi:hypothetical protein
MYDMQLVFGAYIVPSPLPNVLVLTFLGKGIDVVQSNPQATESIVRRKPRIRQLV